MAEGVVSQGTWWPDMVASSARRAGPACHGACAVGHTHTRPVSWNLVPTCLHVSGWRGQWGPCPHPDFQPKANPCVSQSESMTGASVFSAGPRRAHAMSSCRGAPAARGCLGPGQPGSLALLSTNRALGELSGWASARLLSALAGGGGQQGEHVSLGQGARLALPQSCASNPCQQRDMALCPLTRLSDFLFGSGVGWEEG